MKNILLSLNKEEKKGKRKEKESFISKESARESVCIMENWSQFWILIFSWSIEDIDIASEINGIVFINSIVKNAYLDLHIIISSFF